MSVRPSIATLGLLAALSCGGHGRPSTPWAEVAVPLECPPGTELWLMDASDATQPASRPPPALEPDGGLPWPQAAWCQRPDGREEGPYREWHLPGRQLAAEGQMVDGQPSGVWRQYDESGKLTRIDQYVHGNLVRSTDPRRRRIP